MLTFEVGIVVLTGIFIFALGLFILRKEAMTKRVVLPFILAVLSMLCMGSRTIYNYYVDIDKKQKVEIELKTDRKYLAFLEQSHNQFGMLKRRMNEEELSRLTVELSKESLLPYYLFVERDDYLASYSRFIYEYCQEGTLPRIPISWNGTECYQSEDIYSILLEENRPFVIDTSDSSFLEVPSGTLLVLQRPYIHSQGLVQATYLEEVYWTGQVKNFPEYWSIELMPLSIEEIAGYLFTFCVIQETPEIPITREGDECKDYRQLVDDIARANGFYDVEKRITTDQRVEIKLSNTSN